MMLNAAVQPSGGDDIVDEQPIAESILLQLCQAFGGRRQGVEKRGGFND